MKRPEHTTQLDRFLTGVERAGNALPHPFWLFWILLVIVAVLSAVLSELGVEVVDPATGESVGVRNALTINSLRDMFLGAEDSFMSFGPFATVVIVMLGVAVSERSGLFEAIARRSLANVSPRYVTLVVALGGVLGKFLSDSAYVVLIPLGAIAFRAVGRSPLMGMIVAFVSINAAGDANPLIAPGDIVFARLATEAAQLIDPNVTVRPTDNMFFTTVSAFVLAITITLVVELLLRRRESTLEVDADSSLESLQVSTGVTETVETTALRRTGLAALGFALVLVSLLVWSGSPLRGPEGEFLDSPFMNGIAFVFLVFFLLVGFVYARSVGRIKDSASIPGFMAEGLGSITPLIVLFFAVSQFIAVFEYTNMSTIAAVSGAEGIGRLGLPPIALFPIILLLVAVMNLVITSGQALWSLVAPILVPMLMLVAIEPQTTMALYRISDSVTNSITPMSSSFVLCVGYLQTLNKKAGIGTLVSFTLPIATVMMIVWFALFIAWYLIGIPLGPGAPVR
ncbi:AbgT family transporter [Brevibacterium sp. 239c]|uniref:AbgT family transporter n=1 Tax=Brevibacterium sp. 239c TaxID=1965356 RepID=UPI001C610255|nr:AbgT family transporter [Brevibacterium sp. 239c]